MRSAGTKWGIPHDSSGDSTPGRVPPTDYSITARVEEPAGDKHEVKDMNFISRTSIYGGVSLYLSQASKSVEQPIMDELLSKPTVEVDADDPSTTLQKKTLRKSKSVPVANPKRSRGRGRGRVTTVDFESEFMPSG